MIVRLSTGHSCVPCGDDVNSLVSVLELQTQVAMDDSQKTQAQLLRELTALRQRNAALESAAATRTHGLHHPLYAVHSFAEGIVQTMRESLVVLDENFRVVLANRIFYQTFKVTPTETERRVLYELGDQQWNIPRLRLLLEQILPANNSFDQFEVSHTFPHIGQKTMLLNARRIIQEGSKTAFILLAIEDITQRKQAEAALQAQRDWFDGTLSSIGDGVIATDVHSTIIFLNPMAERLTGWSMAEAHGRSLKEVFRIVNEHTLQPPLDDPVTLVLQKGQAVGMANHTLLITRSGTEIPIADSAAPIRDRHGALHGVVLVFRDGTATRRLEAQLRETQRMEALGTLAGGIAHGFNNMLGAILGFTHLLEREVTPDSLAWEYLHEVRTAGLRAKDLVQQMLTFSRRDARDHHPLQLHLLVYETLRLLRASLPATIEIRVQPNTHTGMLMANPTQLQQVLMNLANNAEYAMRRTGGILDIWLDEENITPAVAARHPTLRPGPHLRLTVRDTGPGMAPEVLARLFEPFFTTKEVGEGTGMGLALVHGIVTSHEGAIIAESTPGQGTTFTIYLPRLTDLVSADPDNAAPLLQGEERLLVVEDDVALARLVQVQLTELGYDVCVCTSSREALATFQAAPQEVDLVLTDQTMPHMTGEALVRELRRLRPDLPIILFTGYSPLIDAEYARTLGIDAFLLKPLDLHDLSQTIRQVLAQRQV